MMMSLRRPTSDREADSDADNIVAFPGSVPPLPVKDRHGDVSPGARRNAAMALLALTVTFWTIAGVAAAYLFF